MSEPTVVPYSVPALPDGAGSPREAVLNDIKKQNEQQANLNNTFRGGRRRQNSRRSGRQSSRRSRRQSSRRSSYKSVKRGGNRRESNKRKSKRSSSKRSSNKCSSKKRIVLYGGEPAEVPVPQFGNNSGPNGPNESSANFNRLLLESKQGGIYDKEI